MRRLQKGFAQFFTFVAISSYCIETLDVDSYVEQVTEDNDEYIAISEMQKNYVIQAEQGSLYFTPRFVTSANAEVQNEPQFIPYFPIFLKNSKLINEEYKIGFEQETPIGLDWQLNSESSLFQVKTSLPKELPTGIINSFSGGRVDPRILFGTGAFSSATTWHTVQELTVKQHLWKNAFGERTRAKANEIKHSALAQSYLQKFKLQRAKIQAASVYWQLVIARALKKIRLETLEQAEKLLNYIEMKKNESLVLESEVYQARSIFNTSVLEVEKADEALNATSLSFNSLRGISSPIVNEELSPLSKSLIESMTPQTKGERNDLKAHREMLKNQEAHNTVAIHDLLPEFHIEGAIGLQGISRNFKDSWDLSFTNPALSGAVLIKLTIPLAPTKIDAIKRSYRNSSRSAQLNYERQQFDHDQEWHRLKTRLEENLRILEFLTQNAEVQRDKFKNAELEYSRGLTTFFTVTSAQNDYQSAKIAVLQTFQTLIEILLNLSLYEPD